MRLPNTEYALKKPPSETQIQRQILDYLEAAGYFHFRVNTMGVMRGGKYCPSPNTTRGTADIIAVKQIYDKPGDLPVGMFVAIEVKSLRGKQTHEQSMFQKKVERSGGVYILARTVNDVRAVMEGIK